MSQEPNEGWTCAHCSVEGDLYKVRIDLDEATTALSAYYDRYNEKQALEDVHHAAEALVRAVASLSVLLERSEERMATEIQRHRVLSARVDYAEMMAP